jgi:hypothetical protein
MFHDIIIEGKKGPGIFWEKYWNNIDVPKYNEHILSLMENFSNITEEETGTRFIFIQDNAPAHKVKITKINLTKQRILWI